MSQLGINLYVANNIGADPLASADLATLKNYGIQAIPGQDSVGLANINDPTIAGWWMSPDEPDNAQPNAFGGYGRAVDPAEIARKYVSYRTADPTRPIYLGLGQGVAYGGWWGRGSNPPPEVSLRGRPSFLNGVDRRGLDFDFRRGDEKCPQVWLWAQVCESGGVTGHGLRL